jgi:nucleoid-associated protein YgaU
MMALFLIVPAFLFAQQEMTYEEWEIAIADAQKREQVAKEAIAQEQAQIESLKEQIAATEQQIESIRQETYALLGITQEDVDAWNAEVDALIAKLEELAGLMPEELLKRINELKECEKKLAELKQSKVSWLFASAARIAEVEALIEQVKANLPDKLMTYTVKLIPERRDCLWRISGYEEIYNDPLQWPNIYEANRTQIDNAYEKYKRNVADPKYERSQDLIFPGQVFDIPR